MNLSMIQPNKEKLTMFLTLGIGLILISLIDVLGNTFLDWNLTGFLPNILSYFAPVIIGTIGFYLIRIEFSGNKNLDNINKNIKFHKNDCCYHDKMIIFMKNLDVLYNCEANEQEGLSLFST